MMPRLLVLVDLQEDFLSRPNLSPPRETLVDRAAALLHLFRDNSEPVLHLRTRVSKNPDNRMPHWKAEDRWVCLENTEGYFPPSNLGAGGNELILHKTGFTAPNLVNRVRSFNPDVIILCGVMLHACVRQAALQLHEIGLRVAVADGAVSSDDPVHAAITRRYLQDRGIAFKTFEELSGNLEEVPRRHSTDAETEILSESATDWRATRLADRTQFISGLVELLRRSSANIADRMADDIGKPIRFGRIEIERSAEMASAIASRLSESDFKIREDHATIRRRPHGTVAIITPWNNPFYIPLGKILPALLYGNTVAWKPAPEVQSLSQWLFEALREVGVSESVLQIIPGGELEGRNLVENPRIDAVSLTGSQQAGYSIGEVCSRRAIPFQAELGGNNPAIVWTDADLTEAATKITAGAFEMTGQRCTANRRVIVPETIAPDFVKALVEATSRLRWGNPSEPETQIGPLVDQPRSDLVDRYLRRAEAGGFTLHFPLGQTPEEPVNGALPWCAPCIAECSDAHHELVQEEMFAPVLVVQQAKEWSHALELANGVRQGLAAALFSDDPEKIADFLSEAEAGILKINASTADAAVDTPFGGWKASGIGPPDHCNGDLEFYTRPQTLYT